MHRVFLCGLLCLLLTPPCLASYSVIMAVNLPMSTEQFSAQEATFKQSIATTASVLASDVTILKVEETTSPTRRLLRRLLSASVQVDFSIYASDYDEAGAIGIRLQMGYLNEDFNANGLPAGTLSKEPSFADNDYAMLTCQGCPEGQYLDTVCRQCPAFSSTEPRVNAHEIDFCLCQPGYKPPDVPSSYAMVYNGGFFAVSGEAELTPTLRMVRGRRTVLTWPLTHPFRITTEYAHKGPVYAGFNEAGYVDIAGDAPATLYYYCDAHPHMGVGVIEVVNDQCESCGIGLYKSTLQNTTCSDCPTHTSTQADNSTAQSDCLCVPGYYLKNNVCVVCEGGTFKETLGNQACLTCPDHSDSADNADAVTDCLCVLGYIGDPGGPCIACGPGTYRSNPNNNICDECPEDSYNELDAANSSEHCISCPPNTQSGSGSGSPLACVCDPGYAASRDSGDNAYTCTPCSTGHYAVQPNSSLCDPCGPGTYSTAIAATTADVCTECENGKYNVDTGQSECTACLPATWQNTSAINFQSHPCDSCPAHSNHSVSGSVDVHDCICNPGFYKVVQGDWFVCQLCTAGDYCVGDNTRAECSVNFWSLPGASVCTECVENSQAVVSHGLISPQQCQCVQGYEGQYDANCQACAKGHYQFLDYTYDSSQTELRQGFTEETLAVEVDCLPCPPNTFCNDTACVQCTNCVQHTQSLEGSDDPTDCICQAGFFGPNGGPCALCPVGSFCPGGQHTQPCRVNSNSTTGAQSQGDCLCDPGFFSSTVAGFCHKCPPNSFCPGNQTVNTCSLDSFSPPGASSITQCWCTEGKWRGCILTEDGRSLNADGDDCDIDYTLACSDCGENNICRNNSLLHCQPNSTAPAGSHDPEACVCVQGFYAVAHDPDDHDHSGEVDHEH